MTHLVYIENIPARGKPGGFVMAKCSCGTWRTGFRYGADGDLPAAVRALQGAARGSHLPGVTHRVTITVDRDLIEGGNVWGSCSCMKWGTVQGYVRNVSQGIAEQAVYSGADQHLKEIATR